MKLREFLTRTTRLGFIAAIAFAVTIPSLTLASDNRYDDEHYNRGWWGNDRYYEPEEIFYFGKVNGYERGYERGCEDRYRHRSYQFDRDSEYRHADRGYRGEYRDKRLYQEGFRNGYEKGYYDGFYGFSRRQLRRPDRDRDRFRRFPGEDDNWYRNPRR